MRTTRTHGHTHLSHTCTHMDTHTFIYTPSHQQVQPGLLHTAGDGLLPPSLALFTTELVPQLPPLPFPANPVVRKLCDLLNLQINGIHLSFMIILLSWYLHPHTWPTQVLYLVWGSVDQGSPACCLLTTNNTSVHRHARTCGGRGCRKQQGHPGRGGCRWCFGGIWRTGAFGRGEAGVGGLWPSHGM